GGGRLAQDQVRGPGGLSGGTCRPQVLRPGVPVVSAWATETVRSPGTLPAGRAPCAPWSDPTLLFSQMNPLRASCVLGTAQRLHLPRPRSTRRRDHGHSEAAGDGPEGSGGAAAPDGWGCGSRRAAGTRRALGVRV